MLIVRSAHMSVKSPAKVIVHSKEIYVVSLHDPRTANEFVPILLYKTPCHHRLLFPLLYFVETDSLGFNESL